MYLLADLLRYLTGVGLSNGSNANRFHGLADQISPIRIVPSNVVMGLSHIDVTRTNLAKVWVALAPVEKSSKEKEEL